MHGASTTSVEAMSQHTKQSSIVGIVGEVRRDMEGHHYAELCSVFGLDSEEFRCLQTAGIKIRPAHFEKNDKSEDRYQVRYDRRYLVKNYVGCRRFTAHHGQ